MWYQRRSALFAVAKTTDWLVAQNTEQENVDAMRNRNVISNGFNIRLLS
jgi:hypothetical protein